MQCICVYILFIRITEGVCFEWRRRHSLTVGSAEAAAAVVIVINQMDGLLATALVYVSGYAVLVFLAVCLATGLYYLAELVEENTKLTKTIIKVVRRA